MKPIEEEVEVGDLPDMIRMRKKRRMLILEEVSQASEQGTGGSTNIPQHPRPQRKATKMFGGDLPREDSNVSTKVCCLSYVH